MASGIYTALSGATVNERRVELLSHNLANVNTTGFQGFKMAIEEARGAVENRELSFAGPTAIETDTTRGPVVATGNPLDLSLGEGVYMAVNDNGEPGYVRSSTLVVAGDGRLLTSEGYQVMGDTEPILLPPDARDVQVGVDGMVRADGHDVAAMRLVDFDNREALLSNGGKLWRDPGDAGPVDTTSAQAVLPGYLEMANVNAVKNMTDLISAHNNYNVSLKMIDTFSQVEKKAATAILGN